MNTTITINVQGLDEARRYVKDFPDRFRQTVNDPQVLKEIGTVLKVSAVRSIDMSGYGMAPYKPLAKSTLAARAAKKQGSKPLVAEGTMRLSLDYEVDADGLSLVAADYLKYHQWEEDRKKATFPARQVWGVWPEDLEDISDIILDRFDPEVITAKLIQGL